MTNTRKRKPSAAQLRRWRREARGVFLRSLTVALALGAGAVGPAQLRVGDRSGLHHLRDRAHPGRSQLLAVVGGVSGVRQYVAPDEVTDAQVLAFAEAYGHGLVNRQDRARRALETVRSVLVEGGAPVAALDAGLEAMYAGTPALAARPDLRQPRLVNLLNAVWAMEDRTGQLLRAPGGVVPVGASALPGE